LRASDWLLTILILALVFGGGKVLTDPTLAVVVYESSEDQPEPYVIGGLQQLDIESRIIDQHVVTGDGFTPSYLKPAIEAAQQNGLPAMVVLSRLKVLTVVDLPSTAEGIIDVVQ
tara:strand:- start:77 stop:421 length:345 start_codon:yes stop_codon:yes gene_type:complete